MPLGPLIYRVPNLAGPLTAQQGDDNLRTLANGYNALEQTLGVVLKPNGTLKDDAISDADVIKDGIITEDKLADDAKMPSGMIMPFGGTNAPDGWEECDGTTRPRVGTYAKLFAAIGDKWGIGDGSTTFHLPNLQRHTLIGRGGDGTTLLPNSVGKRGGTETHQLKGDESGMPAHTHTIDWWKNTCAGGTDNKTGAALPPDDPGVGFQPVTTKPMTEGGILAEKGHNNMQPSAVVLYVIKV